MAFISGSYFSKIKIHRIFAVFQSQFLSSSSSPLQSVLIANRGEIACRIIKTARKLGLKTVAVYSDIDKYATHVKMADSAYHLGPPPSQLSYLNMTKIISVAKSAGVQAIHPGYGFLSENAEFAEACQKAGIVFIGPPAAAIRDMGIKSTSKSMMEKAGVPVIKGYHGDDQSDDNLRRKAKEIGFPLMIKAVRGGGGKGMRIVKCEQEFDVQLESAKREAVKSFGDDAVLIEQYVENPRHVEVQIFGDMHGNYIHLFERDCSVQRRHQKIIEEAPAPGLNEDERRSLGEAAVKAARAVNYVGAGTVEFIMDEKHNFYFMEMNTRLQVEHPVTEMITGTDLVEWQFQVASGKILPLNQESLSISGHSFEARIYAEDPDNNFIPGAGFLSHVFMPSLSENIRIETGVKQGDEVSVHYDPMIAKLVVWGKDRYSAAMKLHQCLSEYNIIGLNTNVKFLMDLISHKEFLSGNVHTDFIPQYKNDLFMAKFLSPQLLCTAVMGVILSEKKSATSHIDSDPFSIMDGMIPNTVYQKTISLNYENKEYPVKIQYEHDGSYIIAVDGKTYIVSGSQVENDSTSILCNVDGETVSARVIVKDRDVHVFTRESSYKLSLPMPKFLLASIEEYSQKGAVAPMPGVIEKIMVKTGDHVKKGDPLVVMIAMKMEYVIKADSEGEVESVPFKVGDSVAKNVQLVQIKR